LIIFYTCGRGADGDKRCGTVGDGDKLSYPRRPLMLKVFDRLLELQSLDCLLIVRIVFANSALLSESSSVSCNLHVKLFKLTHRQFSCDRGLWLLYV